MPKRRRTARTDGQMASDISGANRNEDAAGMEAMASGGRWRTIQRRDRTPVLRSPAGREYYGTAAEIRTASLTPWGRRSLADGLGIEWRITKPRSEERAWLVAARRREAIQNSAFDYKLGVTMTTLTNRLAIEAEAAARAAGQSLSDFIAGWVREGINAVRDELGSIPMTQHEREALARANALTAEVITKQRGETRRHRQIEKMK